MNLRIINTDPAYLEQIQELFYKTWLDTYPNKEAGITIEDVEDKFKDRLSPEKLERRKKQILHLEPNKKSLLALDGDVVVGICRGEVGAGYNQLNAIYILPEYQGKGVGTALWNELKRFFTPTKDVTLGVATYNQKAIAFYTKLGFKDTGRRFTDEHFRMKSGAILPEMEMRLEKDLLL